MKIWIRKIHLWLGLPLGVLFFIIAFSGALYSWAPEISTIIYKEKINPQNIPFVSVTKIVESVNNALPKGDFRTVYYRGPSLATQVLLYAPGTYYIANVNPYTGKLIHLQDMNTGWLNNLKKLHRNLLLGDIGREIVHWGTLLFFIMVLSGIALWWPSKLSRIKNGLTINWKARPKALNYNFHNVMGFYASLILIFIIGTGLFWGFKVVKNTFRSLSNEQSITYDIPTSNVNLKTNNLHNGFQIMEQLGVRFRKDFPQHYIRISNPHKPKDPIHVSIIDKSQKDSSVNHFYFDQYTGRNLQGNFEYGLSEKASIFTKVNSLAYDIHFGSVLGFPGRLLAFLASLIAASLPITGFYIWWGKRK
ncbi:PepSY domain-containing protein [Aurantibacter crassamenti]|uniref:PepSY-associated TM helix domain-containing protein n=1 Tax=Aurantibacter crassamenti TaxID=1837375 RepID=UPI0019393637|nr:PepSY-associated TM helix domain-containing protein [Aurantibacter crassamenti]MBM1106511.1 PepSY domain-containing protein [Aurantibacter crassamenti]